MNAAHLFTALVVTGATPAIYSVDVQPNGLRFATAGGGKCPPHFVSPSQRHAPQPRLLWCMFRADGAVRVWSLAPVLSATDESNPGKPKLLAALKEHQAAVQVVRWSPSGRLLASGAGDCFVKLWGLRPGRAPVRTFGDDAEAANIEPWMQVATLRSHSLDVHGVAWSPCETLLATCGLDTKVMVWAVPAELGAGRETMHALLHRPQQELARHTSFVKSVAWDPAGKVQLVAARCTTP